MQRLCLTLFLVLFLFSILWNGYSQNNIDPSLSDLDANGQIDANDILQFAQ